MSVLVVGSIALDSIKTPVHDHVDLLGGSASYAAVAASFFAPVRLVGIVGSDFPQEHLGYFQGRGVDLAGLQVAEGRTFRWSGEYHENFASRTTRSTDLGVFERFSPELPGTYRETPFVLLGNIGPGLQSQVLDQMGQREFVVADTMNLWIDIARDELLALLPRIDMLVLNDEEARQLTGEGNLVRAGRALMALGPAFVAVKKGEHGCLLFSKAGDYFTVGAYPLEEVHDPTGAGDSFVGALVGYLAAHAAGGVDFAALRRAVVHGTVVASFNVEAFSFDRLRAIDRAAIDRRYREFSAMSHYERIA
jgi:sugar/nucleoside kinase (ribokinase family)